MTEINKIKNLLRRIWRSDFIYVIRVSWYYVEIFCAKVRNYLGIKRDLTTIPGGMYCYEPDGRTGVDDKGIPWYGVRNCGYYRSMKGINAGCTYVGFIGWSPTLGDQCKICGEKERHESGKREVLTEKTQDW